MKPQSRNDNFQPVVAGYVRISSLMQEDNFSIVAQKHEIQKVCAHRGLPDPIFYEDDVRSAHTDQIAKRPHFGSSYSAPHNLLNMRSTLLGRCATPEYESR